VQVYSFVLIALAIIAEELVVVIGEIHMQRVPMRNDQRVIQVNGPEGERIYKYHLEKIIYLKTKT
jgi:hypothetical protein